MKLFPVTNDKKADLKKIGVTNFTANDFDATQSASLVPQNILEKITNLNMFCYQFFHKNLLKNFLLKPDGTSVTTNFFGNYGIVARKV